MNKLTIIFFVLLGSLSSLSAQGVYVDKDATADDYENLLEGYLKIEFREKAIKSMGLTEEEIIAFDPIYNEYMSSKRALLEEKFDLTSKYKNGMAENDIAKNEQEETADFIENYWGVEIKEMKLKKNYFDRLEDIMSNRQAINFFLLEESMQNRINRPSLANVVPMIVEFDILDRENEENRKSSSYYHNLRKDSKVNSDKTTSVTETDEKNDLEPMTKEQALALVELGGNNKMSTATLENNEKIVAFNNWLTTSQDGVSLDHKYTHDGLNHLFQAVWTLAEAQGVDLTKWNKKSEKINSMANQLRVDPYSTDHADITRKAFIMIAEMINTIEPKKASSEMKMITESVMTAAKAINPNELMTKQADKVYNFFERAQKSVNNLSVTAAAHTTTSNSYGNK